MCCEPFPQQMLDDHAASVMDLRRKLGEAEAALGEREARWRRKLDEAAAVAEAALGEREAR